MEWALWCARIRTKSVSGSVVPVIAAVIVTRLCPYIVSSTLATAFYFLCLALSQTYEVYVRSYNVGVQRPPVI